MINMIEITMRRILKNAIKCNHCGETIESKFTHDFKSCRCGCVSVDGGLEIYVVALRTVKHRL